MYMYMCMVKNLQRNKVMQEVAKMIAHIIIIYVAFLNKKLNNIFLNYWKNLI